MSKPRYEIVNILTNVSQDKQGFKSDSMSITFRNQGDIDVRISPDTSGGSYILLEPKEERSYNAPSNEFLYVSKWNIAFAVGSGTKSLIVEQEFVKEINYCKND